MKLDALIDVGHLADSLSVCRATAIMLFRFKISYSAVRQALLNLDDLTPSIDDLMAVSKQLPTTEEVCGPFLTSLQSSLMLVAQITRIKDFSDVTKLAKADQFMRSIYSYRISSEIVVLKFVLLSDDDYSQAPAMDRVHDFPPEIRAGRGGDPP